LAYLYTTLHQIHEEAIPPKARAEQIRSTVNSFRKLKSMGFHPNNERIIYQALIQARKDIMPFFLKLRSLLSLFEEKEYRDTKQYIDSLKLATKEHYKTYPWIQDDETLTHFSSALITGYLQKRDAEKKASTITQSNIDDYLQQLEQGPTAKSESTRRLEALLTNIGHYGIRRSSQRVIDFNEYEFTCPCDETTTQTVNLTVLLQSANLTHLELSDETVAQLGKLLEQQRLYGNIPVATLPTKSDPAFDSPAGTILRQAIHYYTLGEESVPHLPAPLFQDANALFRGNPLLNILAHYQKYNSLLFSLIMVSLIAHAMNQWPKSLSTAQLDLLRQSPDKANNTLTRKVDIIDYLRLLLSKSPHITKLDSLTSTSQHPEVNEFDYFKSMQYTLFFKNAPLLPPITDSMEPNETEQLLLPGVQVIYSSGANPHTIEAQIVRHPKEIDSYWPSHALRVCQTHHFNTEYQDGSETITIQEEGPHTPHIVRRPNHGAAHSYRVSLYIAPLIEYFFQYAKDPGFKEFCRTFTAQDSLLLKIAAIFSVTGRKSEMSFSDDATICAAYRRDSANNYRKYLTIHQISQRTTDAEIQRMPEIMEYMSNPKYSQDINTATGEERNRRNYFHWILFMAHQLDLPRCYNSEKYQLAIKHIARHVVDTPEQRRALFAIQHYAEALIQKHGDNLCCKIEGSEFITTQEDYRPIFGLSSNLPKALEILSATVPCPEVNDLAPITPAPLLASEDEPRSDMSPFSRTTSL
jgi:hypothetical protein